VYLHPEVISFYEQVQEQEKNGILKRKDWPGNNSHIQADVDIDIGSNNSSNNVGGREGGGTGEGNCGRGGDA
jgi:hypothetical protein